MKILHLDDHQLFTEGLSAVLVQQAPELKIISAIDAQQAIELLAKHLDIDLILIDLNLPSFDGFDFIRSLETRNIYIPFLILSASENLWDIKKALALGASGYLSKSLATQDILSIISNVMDGQIYVPETLQLALERLPEKEPEHDQQKILATYQLGRRQIDVLQLIKKGYSNDEIANILNLSRNTIKTHVQTLFSAFQVKNRLECVCYAEKIGIELN